MANPLMQGILKKLKKKKAPDKAEELKESIVSEKSDSEKPQAELKDLFRFEEGKEGTVPAAGPAEEAMPKPEAQKKFSKDVEKLSASMGTVREQTDKMDERMKKIEENLANLGSIYELVTNKINPFTEGESVMEQREKRVRKAKGAKAISGVDEAMEIMRKEAPTMREIRTKGRPAEAEEEEEEAPEPAAVQRGPVHKKALLGEIDGEDKRMIEDVIEWLDFLVAKVGFKNMPKLLEYYRDIGWISNEVKFLLEDYITGLKQDNVLSQKGKDKSKKTFTLSADDHKMSLEMLYKIVEDRKLKQGG